MQKRILYLQYFNPSLYPPLEHSSRILANQGWQVLFLGVEAKGSSKNIVFPSHPLIRVSLIGHGAIRLFQKLRFVRFAFWSIWYVISWRPSVIYVSDIKSYPIGYLVSRLSRGKVILHEHDAPMESASRINRVFRWFRKKLAGVAALCVLPQVKRAEKFKSEIGSCRVEVVWNCPSIHEVPSSTKPTDISGLPLWYHGSIVPSQFPIQLAEVMKRVKATTSLTFAGYETIGNPGYIDRFLATARTKDDDTRIQYLGAIPSRVQLYSEASKCRVGVALFEKEFREPMVGASNKPFDYLACGLALLVPNTREWLDFFVDSGCALACDSEDQKSIEDALNWFIANPDETLAMGQRGRQLVLEKWNYEYQFQRVVEFLSA